MAEEFLDGSDVISGFKQVGSKRMAATRGMAGSILSEADGAHSVSHCFLQAALVYVMTADDSRRARVGGEAVGGEYVLPRPLLVGVGVFALQGKG